jgi:DnaJ-class molecular chaperone
MIDKLMEEMTEDCHVCRGSGFKVDSEGQYEEEEACPECNGSGRALSYEGWKFRQLILTGEISR